MWWRKYAYTTVDNVVFHHGFSTPGYMVQVIYFKILSIALSVWYFIGLGFKVYSRLCYRCLKLMWVMAGNCYDEHIGTMIGQWNLKSGCLNRIWCAKIVADNSVLQITPFLSDGLQDVNNTRLFWQTHTRLCSGWVLGIGIQTHCGCITLCH